MDRAAAAVGVGVIDDRVGDLQGCRIRHLDGAAVPGCVPAGESDGVQLQRGRVRHGEDLVGVTGVNGRVVGAIPDAGRVGEPVTVDPQREVVGDRQGPLGQEVAARGDHDRACGDVPVSVLLGQLLNRGAQAARSVTQAVEVVTDPVAGVGVVGVQRRGDRDRHALRGGLGGRDDQHDAGDQREHDETRTPCRRWSPARGFPPHTESPNASHSPSGLPVEPSPRVHEPEPRWIRSAKLKQLLRCITARDTPDRRRVKRDKATATSQTCHPTDW